MNELFERVGDPVLVLHPDDANTVQTVILPEDNERPTVWSQQFKLRKFPLRNAAGLMTALGFPELNLDCRLNVHMYSKGDTGVCTALRCTEVRNLLHAVQGQR